MIGVWKKVIQKNTDNRQVTMKNISCVDRERLQALCKKEHMKMVLIISLENSKNEKYLEELWYKYCKCGVCKLSGAAARTGE